MEVKAFVRLVEGPGDIWLQCMKHISSILGRDVDGKLLKAAYNNTHSLVVKIQFWITCRIVVTTIMI